MIVVDTNIIAYLFLNSERSVSAEQTYLIDPTWAAPLLWRSELRNVLAYYIRKRVHSLGDAKRIMQEALILMYGHEYEVTSDHVLELVKISSCSEYDCEFIALAHDLQVPMVTVDRQILRDFKETAQSLENFVET